MGAFCACRPPVLPIAARGPRAAGPGGGTAPRQPARPGSPREPQGFGATSGAEGVKSDPPLRGDLPEVFPSRDDLAEERDVFASGDDDLDLDDDFDVPSFLK